MLKRYSGFIGFDEAGRGSQNKGEVIVAYFSVNPEDAHIQTFTRGRDTPDARNVLARAPTENYFFAVLTTKQSSRGNSNLALISPFLIRRCLENIFLPAPLENLSIFFDGRIGEAEKALVYQDTAKRYPALRTITIADFKKNGRRFVSKKRQPHIHCPLLGYLADLRAHQLYQMPFEEIATYSRYVPIDAQELVERLAYYDGFNSGFRADGPCGKDRQVLRPPYRKYH